MSVKLMSRVFDHSRATGADRLVLVALAFLCNDKRADSVAWPSLPKLAKMVNIGVSGLCKILNRLEASGDVRRERSNGGKNKRSRYVICLPNSVRADTVSDKTNSVRANSIPQDTVTPNSVRADSQTVSVRTGAINRNRTGIYAARKKRAPRNQESRDTRVKEFLDWFFIEYQNRFGRPYHVKGGKEGNQIKQLLATFDLPTLKRCATVLLETEEPFISQTDRGIGILYSQINKLAGMIQQPAPHPARLANLPPADLLYTAEANRA